MNALRFALFGLVLVSGVGCDHAMKHAATLWLVPGDSISLLGDSLRFELVRNPGAFLSLGAQLPPWVRDVLFVGLAPLALVGLVVWFLCSRATAMPQIFALGLIAAGGLANWIDRLFHSGAVTDFVSVGIGPLRTGIFNLADVWIALGIGALAWSLREVGGKRLPG